MSSRDRWSSLLGIGFQGHFGGLMSTINYQEMLFVNSSMDVTIPAIPSGFVRVAGHIEFRTDRKGMHEYMIIHGRGSAGEYKIPLMKVPNSNVYRDIWNIQYDRNFKHEYIDIPFWLGKKLNICDKYGNLLDLNGKKIHSKRDQIVASDYIPF